MPSYHSGEVVLATLGFTSGTGTKRRPALVLLDIGDDDIVVVPITSHSGQTNFDVVLGDWQRAGLMLASVVRTHKPATIEKRLVERKLGALTPRDWAQVRTAVQQLWATI
jgi:mRNA interferase MazF